VLKSIVLTLLEKEENDFAFSVKVSILNRTSSFTIEVEFEKEEIPIKANALLATE
jgi:hypothetical protein